MQSNRRVKLINLHIMNYIRSNPSLSLRCTVPFFMALALPLLSSLSLEKRKGHSVGKQSGQHVWLENSGMRRSR